MKWAATTLVLFLLPGCCGEDRTGEGWEGRPTMRAVFTTSDGWEIAGDYYSCRSAAGEKDARPTLLLLHMYGSDRSVWEGLAIEAGRRGIAVLAIDLRGHGESITVKGQRRTAGSFNPGTDFRNMLNDVEAALDLLSRSFGAPRRRVVIAGAGMGADLALMYAAGHKDIPAVVLVSPTVVEKGLVVPDSALEYGARPALMIAAREDEYSYRSVNELARRMSGGRTRLYTPEGGGHGSGLLQARPGAVEEEILDFCVEVLEPGQ